MKFVSFQTPHGPHYGVVTGQGIVDLFVRLGSDFPTLRDLMAAGAMEKAESVSQSEDADYGLEEITFLPPVPNPDKIICVGVNYQNRNAEYKDNSDLPQYPSIFTRTPGSLVGHRQEIVRPLESKQLDYEGEIALVIGASGRRIPEDRTRQHLAGLTIMNEGSVRDWLRHGKFNVYAGEEFRKFGRPGTLAGHDGRNLFL